MTKINGMFVVKVQGQNYYFDDEDRAGDFYGRQIRAGATKPRFDMTANKVRMDKHPHVEEAWIYVR